MDGIAPESAILRDLHAYWKRLCGPDRLPSRADIDPIDLGPALPHIVLLDVLGGSDDFVYRLVGTHVVGAAGFDFTGWTVSGFFANMVDDGRVEEYALTVADHRPRYGRYRMLEQERSHFFYERLIMPLAADGRNVDMLFCGFHFRPVDPAQI